MKKTTVFIDEKLLEQAIEITGTRSKREAIEKGLRALIRQYNIEAFREDLGTFDIDLTLFVQAVREKV